MPIFILTSNHTITIPREQNLRGSSCLCLRTTFYAMMHSDDGPDEMLMASFYPDMTDVGPVGSVIMTCQTPMKYLCEKRSEEKVKRSQCPVLSNTVENMCK